MTQFRTDRLVLRPFEAQDAPAIAAALNDKEMCHGLTAVPCPYTLADAAWFIEKGATDASAVCLHDGPLIGAVGLGAQLGYWIAKPFWGQGYASEAARAVLAHHFACNDRDVLSGYITENHASAAVLRKLGFVVTHDKTIHIRSRAADVPARAVVLSKIRWEALQ